VKRLALCTPILAEGRRIKRTRAFTLQPRERSHHMAIIETITETQFIQAFRRQRPDNFSYEGLRQLYNFLYDLSEDTGQPIELDVIALCCDYSEEPVNEVLANYGLNAIDDLADNTVIVWHDPDAGTVLYQPY
jgi:hypothetical protein